MEYVFSTDNLTGQETLKTKNSEPTDFSGFCRTVRDYEDCTIHDSFYILEKINSAHDAEGNYYDWYIIDRHSRYVDHNNILRTIQNSTDAFIIDYEYRLTMLEEGFNAV